MARRGTMLAAFALVAGALAGCGGGSTGESAVEAAPIAGEEIARAAAISKQVESARFSFRLEATGMEADETFALSGSGAVDAGADRAELSLDLSAFATMLGAFLGGLGGPDADRLRDADAWRISAVQEGEVGYVRFPALADRLPDGKSWIRTTSGSSVGGPLELDQLSGAGPKTFLELLADVSGNVETVGTETLHGVETTHHRATLDPAALAGSEPRTRPDDVRDLTDDVFPLSELVEVPLDVWLDGDGLVRKFELDASGEREDGAPARATMSFELWDVGQQVEIELPPSDEVVDAESVQLGG